MVTIGTSEDGSLHDGSIATTVFSENKASNIYVLRNATLPDEPWFASLVDQIPELMYVKDLQGRFVFANATFIANTEVLGAGEWKPGLTDFDYLPPEAAQKLRNDDLSVMRQGEPLRDIEERIVLQNGNTHWYSTTKAPLRNTSGDIIGILGISRNITEWKRQNILNQGHSSLLEMIVHGKPIGEILGFLVNLIESQIDNLYGSILLFREESESLYHGAAPSLAPSYTSLIDGVKIGPAVGSCGTAAYLRQPVIVENIETDPLWSAYRGVALEHGLRSCWSAPVLGAGGVLLGTFALYSTAPRAPSAKEIQLISMACNLAGIAMDRHRTDEHIRFMAHHDPLTGLSNRNLFWTQLDRAIQEACRANRPITVAYIDLDNFKQINDSLGHAHGDQVLRAVANRISAHIRASDMAARLGGDEFAIVFSSHEHDDDSGAAARLRDIQQAISRPVQLQNGQDASATCSIGVASFPRDGDTPETLLAHADTLMYAAKKAGRNRLKMS